jgi:lysosomal alpha-mannosidase
MGDDFSYVNAYYDYENMDFLINQMNLLFKDKYVFQYSTPSDYIDALAKYQKNWNPKYDDLFPYSDELSSYWTGFYSSRANLKEYIKRASNEFHS